MSEYVPVYTVRGFSCAEDISSYVPFFDTIQYYKLQRSGRQYQLDMFQYVPENRDLHLPKFRIEEKGREREAFLAIKRRNPKVSLLPP